MTKYAHLELNRDVPAPSGYYTPHKEVRLKYDGREVLYVLSQAVIDSSCCGVSDFSSALVPGYIVKWRAETNKEGVPVSEVEPVTDEKARDAIRKYIRETEHVSQTEFW
jgi:hypothetical protein